MEEKIDMVWLKNELNRQKNLKTKLETAFDCLENKTTDYANGIQRTLQVRIKIVQLLKKETDKN